MCSRSFHRLRGKDSRPLRREWPSCASENGRWKEEVRQAAAECERGVRQAPGIAGNDEKAEAHSTVGTEAVQVD